MRKSPLVISMLVLTLLVSCQKKTVETNQEQTVVPSTPVTETTNTQASTNTSGTAEQLKAALASSIEAPKEITKEMPVEEVKKQEEIREQMIDAGMIMKPKWMYTDYAQDLIGKTEKTVLFFHALGNPASTLSDSLVYWGDIPENVTVLKVNYDGSEELKKKYEIADSNTFVQVDKSGKLLKKWSGGATFNEIVSNIQ